MIDQVVDRLKQACPSSPYPIIGSSEGEIAAFEHESGIKLPTAYRSFLKLAGKSFGPIFRDIHYRTHEPELVAPTFSAFIEQIVSDHIKLP